MAESYGDILRETREQLGISVRDISRELHVREDIVVSLEVGDFSKIPPQGYSRNMIKSYARLLGLDAKKVTDMFLDAEYSYQIGKKRASVQNIVDENRKRIPESQTNYSGFRTPRQRIALKDEKRNSSNASGYVSGAASSMTTTPRSTSPFSNRTIQSMGNRYNNTPRARRENDMGSLPSRINTGHSEANGVNAENDFTNGQDYASARSRLEARKKNNQPFDAGNTERIRRPLGRSKNANLAQGLPTDTVETRKNSKTDNETLAKSRENKSVSKRVNFQDMHIFNNGKSAKGPQNVNMLLIGIIVAVLIVVLILVMFFAGRQVNNSKMDMSDVNVTGLTDPEKVSTSNDTQSASSNTQSQDTTEPTKAVFNYKITGSNPVYMEITVDDKKELAREVKPGETDNFDVTGVLKFVTTKPDGVTISVDGATVQPVDENKVGIYTYTVDFQKILKDWKTKNGKA